MKCQNCNKERKHLFPYGTKNKLLCLNCFTKQRPTKQELLKAKEHTEKVSKSFIGKLLKLKPYSEYVKETKIQFGAEKAKKIFMLQFTPYFKKQAKKKSVKKSKEVKGMKKVCENCGNKTSGVEIASMFTGRILCLTCWTFVYEFKWNELKIRAAKKMLMKNGL